jgi:PncC family amidohydrolase
MVQLYLMKKGHIEVVAEVHRIFTERGLTLSIAESCTGGLISHYITSLPGASAFYRTGIVAYSGEMKIKILNISEDTVKGSGVISDETAREMAEKIRLMTKTDYSLSTTGNLGPDVLEGKEKGLIYIAVCREGGTASQELSLKGKREANKEEASLQALRLLIDFAS